MDPESVDRTRYPFSIRAFADGIDIELTTDVTFFVGENGSGKSTLLVSTHSPILLSYPGAVLLSRDGAGITRVEYTDTEHYRLTKDFLACPERYFRHLFAFDDEEGGDPRKR